MKTVTVEKILVIVIFFCLILKSNAQNDEIWKDITPPSLDNYQFTKYGDASVQNNTGAFVERIPIFTAIYGDIKISTSLNYFTNGVQVNDIAGIVGMGWNLNAGGMITRIVKGVADENNLKIYRPTSEELWYTLSGNYSDNEYQNSQKENIKSIWRASTDPYSGIDSEQDVFSFNFFGHTGKFFIDGNNIHINENDDLHAEFTVLNSKFTEFVFVDTNGIKFYFGGIGYDETSKITNTCGNTYLKTAPTAWHLKRVIDTKGREVLFNYQNYGKSYPMDKVEYYNLAYSNITFLYPFETTSQICTSHFTSSDSKALTEILFGTTRIAFEYFGREDYQGKILKKIVVYSGEEIIKTQSLSYLYSSTSSGPAPSYNKRAFLSQLTSDETSYKFQYKQINSLPARLSSKQDIFGYANNNHTTGLTNFNILDNYPSYQAAFKQIFTNLFANRTVNTQLSLCGTLEKITYPTGGYLEIGYENNVGYEPANVKVYQTQSISTQLTKCHQQTNPEYPLESSITFTSNGKAIRFQANSSVDQCEGVFIDDIHDVHTVTIRNITTGLIVANFHRKATISIETSDNPTAIIRPVNTVSGHVYKVTYKVGTKFNDIFGLLNLQYNETIDNTVREKNYSGARVSYLKSFDGSKSSQKNYNYKEILSTNPLHNSLQYNHLFNPLRFSTKTYITPSGEWDTEAWSDNAVKFSTNNIYSQMNSNSDRINYKFISEYSENGAIEREYDLHLIQDNNSQLILNTVDDFQSSNEDFLSGTPVKIKFYGKKNNTFTLLKEIENKYEILKKQGFPNYNYSVGINQTTLDPYDNSLFNSNPDVGCTSVYCQVQGKVGMSQYLNNVFKSAITENITTEYLDNGIIINILKYSYESEKHYQLTSSESLSSSGSAKTTRYFYPDDIVSESTLAGGNLSIQHLTAVNSLKKNAKHKTSQIVQIDILENDRIYSTRTSFKDYGNGIVMPEIIESSKGLSTLDSNLVITKYDTSGNPIEITNSEGISTAFIWGYNQTQPIAKIENLGYAAVPTNLIATVQTASNALPYDEQALLIALASLRSNVALAEAMVTTYTHKPLVGITSIIDPKGDKVSYEYDSFNRLKLVRDMDGNILSENQYRYRTQN